MPVDFYFAPASAPCRAVMLTAKALGVELNKKMVNLTAGEHMKPEFLKMNPQHCIPTIVDDKFTLWESRAIQVYLATKYGSDDTLYPNDAMKRALVQQRLNFDLGTLFHSFRAAYHPMMFMGIEKVDPLKLSKIKEVMYLLDGFLSQSKWAAGDNITVADHSLVASISQLEATGYDLSPFKNVTQWYKQCLNDMPGFKEAMQGATIFKRLFEKMVARTPKILKMPVDFYFAPPSAPCRAVMLTAKALGVELNKKMVNLMAGEHMKPEFLKINPQHCIPTIVDDKFTLWESRAIQVYLATKYGGNDTLYPNDAMKRALVQQRLNFDLGTLYQCFMEAYYPPMFMGVEKVDPQKLSKITEAMDLLDGFLSLSKWAAGDNITVADHSLVATISQLIAAGYDLSPFNNVTKWFKQCHNDMPGFKEVMQGAAMFKGMADKMLAGKF